MQALAPSRSRKRVPQHLLRAARRIDRTLDFLWCEKRNRWVVTRKGNGTDRCIINGQWYYGRHIVIRWEGEDSEYLPLSWLLVNKLRDMDSASRASWQEHLAELEAMEGRQKQLEADDMAARKGEAKNYIHSRHVVERVFSVPGYGQMAKRKEPAA